MLLPGRGAAPAPSPAVQAGSVPVSRLLLAVAALTGMSSFMYEIGWIRMLALVLGSSTHAFELMLSAFILGLAFGGLWVRRRIDAASDTLRLLGLVQVIMGLAALATLPVYLSSFQFMQFAVQSLARTAGGYLAFNVVSHGICLAVMFPAAFCAGMTLPLITASLLRAGGGERAIGQVYAANTAGAILGVVVAVHLGLPLLGLKGLIIAGAVVDLALGLALLGVRPARWRWPYAAAALSIAALCLAVFGVRLDPLHLASGVYRSHTLLRAGSGEEVKIQLDGKTTTVSVTGGKELLALRTNGKSEGAIRIDGGAPTNDEITMTLTGALPLLLAPDARRIANIGFGTGLTTHVLLASDGVETVDTVEIEPAVARAGALLRPFNERALADPRSRLHFDDAKTYFSARQVRYDVIVSEPSNPWVSGVASLFSFEFYRDVRRYLRDGGLLVQWINVYETTPELVATVMTALDANFSDYELWTSNAGDLIVVAVHNGTMPPPDARALANPRLRAELERFNIRSLDDLLLHRIARRAALRPYFAAFGVPVNSDFYPVLDQHAAQARFLGRQADDLTRLLEVGLPLLDLFDRPRARQPDPARLSPGERPWLNRSRHAVQAHAAGAYLLSGKLGELAPLPAASSGDFVLLRAALVDCRVTVPPPVMRRILMDVAWFANQHLAPAERDAVWRVFARSPCSSRLTEMERQWLRLHSAIAAESAAEVVQAAQRILEADAGLPQELTAYAVAAHMTGLLLAGRGNEAMKSFLKHRERLIGASVWQPVFRFLVAQTGRN
jgi:spermidine synthase